MLDGIYPESVSLRSIVLLIRGPTSSIFKLESVKRVFRREIWNNVGKREEKALRSYGTYSRNNLYLTSNAPVRQEFI